MKKSFISSIKSGYPFGSLLLYKVGEVNGITKYNLIDGLQRSSTLLDYTRNPTKFFDEEDVDEAFLKSALDIFKVPVSDKERYRQDLISITVKWVKDLQGFTEEQGFSSYAFATEILKSLGFDLNDHTLVDATTQSVMSFVKKIRAEADISSAKVPIVIYYGEEANLPEIFEKINSQGTKLNKYQIYAATWATKYGVFKIKDRTIKDHIKNKYDSLIEEGLQVDNYETNPSTFYTSEFTYFEYVFGLGKFLSQKYPELFGGFDDGENADATDSIGFNLSTICLGIDLKNINSLPEKLQVLFEQKQGQENFLQAIDDATAFVFSALKPFITLQANKKKGTISKTPIYHTEFQIVSLIGKVFVNKYDLDALEIKEEWKKKKNTLEENLAYHYLYDIIREFWRGSGDLKANEVAKIDSRYDVQLSKVNWNNVLDEWFTGQLQRREVSRAAFKNADILFLKYIYTHLLSVYEDVGRTEFEIEHLVPVGRLKNIAGKYQGLPISAVSNLCLITKELNQTKSDYTIYEYYNQEVEDGTMSEKEANDAVAEIEQYTFTKRTDLEFVLSPSKFDKDTYIELLEKRFSTLKQKFFSLNKIV